MKIIAPGTYPEENERVCPECGCRFKYFNTEAKHECSTPDEEAMFGGFGSYKSIKCPECDYKIIFDYQFTPTYSWVDGICNWFRKISNKIINIFRKEKD